MGNAKGEPEVYDLLIVGGGPAGLSAALDAKYLKLKTVVIEAHGAGGALSQTYPWKPVDSFLGFNDKVGREIAAIIVGHVRAVGAELRENEEVKEIRAGKPITVETSGGEYKAKAVILATGVRGIPRKLGVPGEDMEGVDHFVMDPKKFKGKQVLVVGGGDSAVECALGLDAAGSKVFLAHRRDSLRAIDENIENLKNSGTKVLWNTEVDKISGQKRVESVTVSNNKTGEKTELKCDNIFVCIGSVSLKDNMERIGIKIENVSIDVDENGMTNIPGIFAAGDIVCKIKRIPQALATGETAAFSAYKFIKSSEAESGK